MQTTGVFPSMVLQMCAIGEESGSLDAMLGKVAEFYEDEVDEAVKGLSSLMEPIIMVILGVLIGGMVIVDVPADLQARPGRSSACRWPAARRVLLSPLVLALLGLCVGSFLNVVIHRLPLMLERGWRRESAELLGVSRRGDAGDHASSTPRSRCPSCGHAITLVREHSAR